MAEKDEKRATEVKTPEEEVESDPYEREELMFQADLMNGLSANKFS